MNNATPTSPAARFRLQPWPLLGVCGLLGFGFVLPVQAQAQRTVTAEQRDKAQQVAQQGVPLSELAADAPDQYTVKPADTLWGSPSCSSRAPGAGPNSGA